MSNLPGSRGALYEPVNVAAIRRQLDDFESWIRQKQQMAAGRAQIARDDVAKFNTTISNTYTQGQYAYNNGAKLYGDLKEAAADLTALADVADQLGSQSGLSAWINVFQQMRNALAELERSRGTTSQAVPTTPTPASPSTPSTPGSGLPAGGISPGSYTEIPRAGQEPGPGGSQGPEGGGAQSPGGQSPGGQAPGGQTPGGVQDTPTSHTGTVIAVIAAAAALGGGVYLYQKRKRRASESRAMSPNVARLMGR